MIKFQFESMLDLLSMSGHGPYVWGSYLVTFLAIGILIYIPYKLKRQLVAQVRRQKILDESSH